MKRSIMWIVIILALVVLIAIIILLVIGKGANVEINNIQREESRMIIDYSVLGEFENPKCVLNAKRGDIETIEFPLSCPVSPAGDRLCSAQSHSAVVGENQLEVWNSLVDLTSYTSFEVCCISSENPLTYPENQDLIIKNFICSSTQNLIFED